MDIKPIKSEKDYKEAMMRLEELFDAKKDTPEGDELEILGILIDQYENENFPIELPDPIEAIKFRMEQLDYSQSDLAKIIGLKSLDQSQKFRLKGCVFFDEFLSLTLKNLNGFYTIAH